MNIVAIIPARSGSKSIINKNIRIMNGKHMIAYSIEDALMSKKINRVIVSTDSAEYAKIAKEYGAEVPFLRPKELSEDDSLDIEVFQHMYNYLKTNENYIVDIFVHLRPTHPIRNINDIDNMVQLLQDSTELDSIRSVSLSKQVPYKMWLFDKTDDIKISPLAFCDIKEAYNAPRQSLPTAYMQNACIDVVRGDIINNNSMTGNNVGGYKMDYDFDIDTEEEFLTCEKSQLLYLAEKNNKKLKVCCDIDGIIAEKNIQNDYGIANPIYENINIINNLYDKGHTIILFTARGYVTAIDWSDITKKQLLSWNVKYHELYFGKPNADIYIDDKFIEINKLKGF